MGEDAIEVARRKGNVNTQGAMAVQVLDLSEASREAQLQHEDTMRRFEAQTRARAVIVPTDVEEVKQKLRSLGHPITVFGEGPADRRERLKTIIAAMELDAEDTVKMQVKMMAHDGSSSSGAGGDEMDVTDTKEMEQKKKETFYTHASDELIRMREALAKESFEKTQQRLLGTKRIRQNEQLQLEDDKQVAMLYKDSKQLSLVASQYADERPLTMVRTAKDTNYFASSSLNPVIKVWNAETSSLVTSLVGHIERVTSVTWHPDAFKSSGPALLASTSADSSCLLWDARTGDSVGDSSIENRMEISGGSRTEEDVMRIAAATNAGPTHSSAILKLQGHQGVVSRCEFHPNGKYIGTAGYDFSWRLWDVETGKELLLQDGHSRECSAIAFQADGALVFTADWAGVCLLWDLRSGQVIQTFQGHIKKVVNAHFSPNGFQVATASVDNLVRIWDVRKKKCGYALPAHSSIISDVRYSGSGELLLTSSFDGKLKIWGARDYRLLRVLSGHAGKVMSCDFGSSERQVVSAGFDRTVKIWSNEE